MTLDLRRLRAALPCLFLALALAGCAQTAEETKDTVPPGTIVPPASAPVTGTLKVALATPGPISDKGWSASAYEGLQRIKSGQGAEVAQVELKAPGEYEGTFRNLAEQGYQVIFGHGSEYDEKAAAVASKYPKTTFVITGGRSVAPNLMPIQFQAGQATYIAGMVAAGMSKTNKIGLVGGPEIPIIRQAFKSFEKGAKAVKPGIQIRTVFTGDGEDTAKAKQAAQALLDGGADVLMHNANAAGLGVFQAVEEREGAMVIGANADQSDLATPKNIGSFVLDVPNAMTSVAAAVKEGKGGGKPYEAGLKDGAVAFIFNPKFQGTVPPELKTQVEQAKADIIAGKIDPKPDSGGGG